MRLALAATAAAVILAGCSAGSSSTDSAAFARVTLRQDVYRLTALAANKQYVPARGWLEQVQQDMMYARSSGAIGVAQEDRIAALVGRVGRDLAIEIAAQSATSAAPSSSAAPTPPRTVNSRPTRAPVGHRKPAQIVRSRAKAPRHKRATRPHRKVHHRHHAKGDEQRGKRHRQHARRHHHSRRA